jgi:hypothetical protein
MHQGYNLKKNGFRKPAEAHFSENLTLIDINKDSVSVETESIKGEKRVGEHLPFTHDSVETENNNKEVLKYQLVTRS